MTDDLLQKLIDTAHTVTPEQEITDMRAAVDALEAAVGDWQSSLDKTDPQRHLEWGERPTATRRRLDGRCRKHCLVCRLSEIQSRLSTLTDATKVVHRGAHASDIPVPATTEIAERAQDVRRLLIRHGYTPTGAIWRTERARYGLTAGQER